MSGIGVIVRSTCLFSTSNTKSLARLLAYTNLVAPNAGLRSRGSSFKNGSRRLPLTPVSGSYHPSSPPVESRSWWAATYTKPSAPKAE